MLIYASSITVLHIFVDYRMGGWMVLGGAGSNCAGWVVVHILCASKRASGILKGDPPRSPAPEADALSIRPTGR